MLVEAEAAEQVIAQVRAEPRGVVRMSCPVGLLNFQFAALIARFIVASATYGGWPARRADLR